MGASSRDPVAAEQTYGVQVRVGPQSIVTGNVQPEAVMAVKVRIRPRTTLYFKPDITTPSVGEMYARGELYYAVSSREAMGMSKFQKLLHLTENPFGGGFHCAARRIRGMRSSLTVFTE